MDLLRFLEWQVGQSASGPVVQKIRNAAEALLTGAIEAYEAVRVEDRSEELEARERARARMAQLLAIGDRWQGPPPAEAGGPEPQ